MLCMTCSGEALRNYTHMVDQSIWQQDQLQLASDEAHLSSLHPSPHSCWLPTQLRVICSAKALSKYTEMVDQVIRQQKDKLEAASDEARLRLREWDMPEALQVTMPSCTSHLLLATLIRHLQRANLTVQVSAVTQLGRLQSFPSIPGRP